MKTVLISFLFIFCAHSTLKADVKVIDADMLIWKDPKQELPYDNQIVLVHLSIYSDRTPFSGKVYTKNDEKFALINDKFELSFKDVHDWALLDGNGSK